MTKMDKYGKEGKQTFNCFVLDAVKRQYDIWIGIRTHSEDRFVIEARAALNGMCFIFCRLSKL